MAGSSQGTNGQVTNAILLARMETQMTMVMERLKLMDGKLDFVTENKTKIEALDDRLDAIEAKSNRIDVFLTAGTIIGTILGMIFGNRPA
jgi:tetrahydromethanopterin S-methyltransferase subunit G